MKVALGWDARLRSPALLQDDPPPPRRLHRSRRYAANGVRGATRGPRKLHASRKVLAVPAFSCHTTGTGQCVPIWSIPMKAKTAGLLYKSPVKAESKEVSPQRWEIVSMHPWRKRTLRIAALPPFLSIMAIEDVYSASSHAFTPEFLLSWLRRYTCSRGLIEFSIEISLSLKASSSRMAA